MTTNNTDIVEIATLLDKNKFTEVEKLLMVKKYVNTSILYNKIEEEKTSLVENFGILSDYGSGQINIGIKSLNSLSLIISGKGSTPVRYFNKILYGDKEMVKLANVETMRKIILTNLKVFHLIPILSRNERTFLNEMYVLIDAIGREIKNGIFDMNKHKKSIISYVKKLVRLANKYTIIEGNK
jgi:hypothetical protein